MIKPIAIALTFGLAVASATTWADDPQSRSSSESSMQRCVTSAKAKNDGTPDEVINRTCTSQITKHRAESNGDHSATVTDETTTTTDRNTTTEQAPPK